MKKLDIQNTEKPIEELLNFSIININKPSHITSFGVVDQYERNSIGIWVSPTIKDI